MMRYQFLFVMMSSALITGCGEPAKEAARPAASAYPASKAEAKASDRADYDIASAKSVALAAASPVNGPAFRYAANEALPETPRQEPENASEAYDKFSDNRFRTAKDEPLSTFSIDVDTASYANMRRFLNQGQLPPADAVRIEEMVNYFTYNYPIPEKGRPFSTNIEVASCPWNPTHQLLRIGLKGYEVPATSRPLSNLVFLIDVSGSMQDPRKLPLLKNAMKMLVDQLGENDRIAIVVYAGAAGMVLDSTTADRKETILTALENLQAGGSTNGGAGIQLAYQLARKHYVSKSVNRVILCTDGDFNVGPSDSTSLVNLIEEQARSGVFLTVLGFGMGNYKDAVLEKIADKGNGNYSYIDTIDEARKVLVDQMSGTLITIAKDVKVQIEFNPSKVASYRLIGYENRILAKEDFDNDRKDAGEIGAGHTVTALYELVPPGVSTMLASNEPLKYQAAPPPSVEVATTNPQTATVAAATGGSDELLTLKLRYKQPDGATSELIEVPVKDEGRAFSAASTDFAWAASVAAFGMILRDSAYKGNATLPAVLEMARASKGSDTSGYRAEFIKLVEAAIALKPTPNRSIPD